MIGPTERFYQREEAEERAEIDEIIRKAKENGTYLKAPNGKKSKLSPRQWAQVRTRAFKKWFGDWERLAIVKEVRNLRAAKITPHESLDKAQIKETFKSFGEVENERDGRRVVFPASTAGKIQRHKGFPTDTVIKSFKNLFEKAVPILSEKETVAAGHKEHRNFDGYEHYVSKMTVEGVDYFVRFTVMSEHKGRELVHSSFVSEVSIYKERSSAVGHQENLSEDATPNFVDRKLADFLNSVNEEGVSKVIDENGEPLVVYHGSRSGGEFSVFDGSSFFVDNKDVANMFRSEAGFRLYVNGELYGTIDNRDAEDVAYALTQGDYSAGEFVGFGNYELDESERERLSDILHNLGVDSEAESIKLINTPEAFETFLNIRNPLVLDYEGKEWSTDNPVERFFGDAKKGGHDGVIVKNIVEGGPTGELLNGDVVPPATDFITFSPEQIKSATDNTGAFDGSNPDIRFQREEEAQPEIVPENSEQREAREQREAEEREEEERERKKEQEERERREKELAEEEQRRNQEKKKSEWQQAKERMEREAQATAEERNPSLASAETYKEYVYNAAVLVAALMVKRNLRLKGATGQSLAMDCAKQILPEESEAIRMEIAMIAAIAAKPLIEGRRKLVNATTQDIIDAIEKNNLNVRASTLAQYRRFENLRINPAEFARAQEWMRKHRQLVAQGRVEGTKALTNEQLKAAGVPELNPKKLAEGADIAPWVDAVVKAVEKMFPGDDIYARAARLGTLRKTLYAKLRDSARGIGDKAAMADAFRTLETMLYKANTLERVIELGKDVEQTVRNGVIKGTVSTTREQIYQLLFPYRQLVRREPESERKTDGLTEMFLHFCFRVAVGEEGYNTPEQIEGRINELVASLESDKAFNDPRSLERQQELSALRLMLPFAKTFYAQEEFTNENGERQKRRKIENSQENLAALRDIFRLLEDIREQGAAALDAKMARKMEQAEKMANALSDAIEVLGRDLTAKNSSGGRILDILGTSLTGAYSIKQELEDCIRFCNDPVKRAAAQKVIDAINLQLAQAETKRNELAVESREWFVEMLGRIFNKDSTKNWSAKDATNLVAKLTIPDKKFAKFSATGDKALSVLQVAAQVAMLQQKDIQAPFETMTKDELDNLDPKAKQLYKRIQMLDEMKKAIGPDMLAVIEEMNARFLQEAPEIDKIAMEISGVPLTMRTADYFPVVRAYDKATINRIRGVISYIPPFMTERVENTLDIDENADIFSIFLRRCEDVAHFRAFGLAHMDLARMLFNDRLGSAIKKTNGTRFLQQLTDHIQDVLSPKLEGTMAYGGDASAGLLSKIVAHLALGGNFLVMFRQATSLPAYLFSGTWRQNFLALTRGFASGKLGDATREFVNSPQWKARYASAGVLASGIDEHRILTDILATNNGKRFWRWCLQALMAPNRWGDRVPILIMGVPIYQATKQELLGKINPATRKPYTEKEASKLAMDVAWDATEKTQQTGRISNMGVWQRRGGALAKTIGQFQSTTTQFFGAELRAIRDLAARPGDSAVRRKFFATIATNHIFLPGLYWGMTQIWSKLLMGDDDFDDDDWKTLLAAMIAGPLSGWWLIGGAIYGAIFGVAINGGSYAGATAPVFSTANRFGRAGVKIAKGAASGDVEKVEKGALDLVKMFAPVRDLMRIYSGWIDDDGKE